MTPDQEAIAAEITETEVPAAFADCKTGKANGPDLLGNDWYRRSAPLLIPIFTIFLNQWYLDVDFPPFFLEANIFCLQKGGDQSEPLNYQPIALLNTDYKIFAKIFTKRVRRTLAARVRPNQNDFVPGRTIYETLHIFGAVQGMFEAESDAPMP
ncbi:hypothetical protein PC129_g12386 [Phytophthora cactorum]|uniref:Reverse transcriptase domain-containing protein n=1 Tax=Phytophthora cactorum TaxID=29920 RepID=A0A329RDQ4_9STRA|nr:hypothetical protein Pcac1_g15206 [Phytophthora cactorum]KAG2887074.1 hypothetical protein PC114_g18967 [Phytophthora cactorum]KAG2926730.1 hypothetical protein PC117_g14791 [Phytophthora cactorum]KAG2963241.1 hypothetical protein PC118_g20995 [Phytophthora cactorum]KAG2987353.1 hypothetical protein PC119_g19699 [Phytophthora cactorum]